MILEFVGLPGSGKTTVEDTLLNRLKDWPEIDQNQLCFLNRKVLETSWIKYRGDGEQFNCERVQSLKVSKIRLSFFYLKHILQAVAVCLKRGRLSYILRSARFRPIYWFMKDVVLSSFFIDVLEKGLPFRTVYSPSEGLAQHMAILGVWTPRIASLREQWFSKYSSNRVCLVYLRISVEAGFQRLRERGIPESWPNKYKKNRELAYKKYLHFAEHLETVIGEFEKAGATIIPLDVDCKFEDVERQVAIIANAVLEV